MESNVLKAKREVTLAAEQMITQICALEHRDYAREETPTNQCRQTKYIFSTQTIEPSGRLCL